MLYINDFCSIGPMGVFQPDTDISEWRLPVINDADSILYALEPDYRAWISPIKQRRMSKPVRMGVAAMKMCFGNDAPGSIHMGSAFGQLSDSQRFLEAIMDGDQGALSPTSFIQSTHNTVSGALALEAGVYGHNYTFVNAGHSFEDAFYDAVLTDIDTNSGNHQLVGAVDEIIPMAARTIQAENCTNTPLGEGCAVFKMSASRDVNCLAQVLAFEKVIAPADGHNIHQHFGAFLKTRHLAVQTNDLWVYDPQSVRGYEDLQHHFFQDIPPFNFKTFCGNYPTHAAFGLAYALNRLNRQLDAGRIWLITHFGTYWGFWLLAKSK